MSFNFTITPNTMSLSNRPGRGGNAPTTAKREREQRTMTAAALDPALSGWTYYGEANGSPIYELVRGGVQIAVAQRDGEENGKPRWYFETIDSHVTLVGGFPECARLAIEGDSAIAKEL